jgi:hypothetical protein
VNRCSGVSSSSGCRSQIVHFSRCIHPWHELGWRWQQQFRSICILHLGSTGMTWILWAYSEGGQVWTAAREYLSNYLGRIAAFLKASRTFVLTIELPNELTVPPSPQVMQSTQNCKGRYSGGNESRRSQQPYSWFPGRLSTCKWKRVDCSMTIST